MADLCKVNRGFHLKTLHSFKGILQLFKPLLEMFWIIVLMLISPQLISGNIRRAIARHDHTAVLALFPVLRHLRSVRPEFEVILEVK